MQKRDSFAGCWSSKKNEFNMGRHTRRKKSYISTQTVGSLSGSKITKNILDRVGQDGQAQRQRLTWPVLGQVGGPSGLGEQRVQVSAPHPSQLSLLQHQPQATLLQRDSGSPHFPRHIPCRVEGFTLEQQSVIQSTRVKQLIYGGEQSHSSKMKTIPKITHFLQSVSCIYM